MGETFSTCDIVLASTLLTLKFPVLDYEIEYRGSKTNSTTYFLFEDSARFQDAKMKITNKLVTVEPYTFHSNLRMLKSQIRNFQDRRT